MRNRYHPLLCHGVGEFGCQSRPGTLATSRSEDGEYLCCDACFWQASRRFREESQEVDADFVRQALRATLKERHVTRRAARGEARAFIEWLRDDAARRAA